jgi:hypothetical protein
MMGNGLTPELCSFETASDAVSKRLSLTDESRLALSRNDTGSPPHFACRRDHRERINPVIRVRQIWVMTVTMPGSPEKKVDGLLRARRGSLKFCVPRAKTSAAITPEMNAGVARRVIKAPASFRRK